MPTLTANGLSLAVESQGDPSAPAMLLVMGLGMPLVFWPDALVEGLVAAGFRVVRFDNRDCGASQRVADGPRLAIPVAMARAMMGMPVDAPYTLADMALDAAGVLDALGIARAHVVGASLGGMIAQVLAARHPARVASLASVMSGSGNPYTAVARPRALSAILHKPADPGSVESVTGHLVQVMGAIGSTRFPPDPAALRAHCERTARRGYDSRGVARQILAMLASGDRREEIRGITAPTLVIHGDDDPLIPRSAGREVARLVPGARLLEIEGMAHDLPLPLLPGIVEALAAHARAADASAGRRAGP